METLKSVVIMEEGKCCVDPAKQANCTWAEFSLHDAERLLDPSSDDNVVRQILCERLVLNSFPPKQRQILLDLYTYTWLFGKKEIYSPAQLSTILSIVKRIHAKCTSTARENLNDVLTDFQELMVQHSVNRPPFSHSIFTPCQVKNITDFILSTYFKHYKLYKYAFTKKLHLNVSLSYAGDVEEEDEVQEEETLTEKASSFSQVMVDPVKLRLKEILSDKLTRVVERQQASLKAQLLEQETTLLTRISTLEKVIDNKKDALGDGEKKKTK